MMSRVKCTGGLLCVLIACQREVPANQPALSVKPQEPVSTAVPVSAGQYLRQLSLDLRGRPASLKEMDEAGKSERLDAQVIDGMLSSEEFLSQVELWHADLIWPNITRYRPRLVDVFAAPINPFFKPESLTTGPAELRPYSGFDSWWGGGDDISPDPVLVENKMAREKNVVAINVPGFRVALRGTAYAYAQGRCDVSAEAEYPDPSVVGTAQNEYTVPAERSGTGQAYKAKFYSEDPASRGAVMPICDYLHCPNYCRRKDCDNRKDFYNVGASKGCFTAMEADGVDVLGRHPLDAPGKRCPDGYEREINGCDFQKVGWEEKNPPYTIDGKGEVAFRVAGRPAFGTQVYGHQVEGWRWAEHYWSQGVKVRTCALEAQDREYGLYQRYPDGRPVECSKSLAAETLTYFIQDASCGCGPKGAYCGPQVIVEKTGESRSGMRLRKSIESEPLRIIRNVVNAGEDYSHILTTRQSVVNGSLAFAWSYQRHVLRGEGFNEVTPPDEKNPIWGKIPFEEEAWTTYQRPERHAGILTTLQYLQRFPTYRARVARYRRAFLCSTEFDFAPQPDPTDSNPDISARNGCGGCHQRLERDGMYFGRYPDRTPIYLDPREKPKTDTFFAQTFQYQAPELMGRVDQGPSEMVNRDLAQSQAFERCTVQTLWERLVRRPPSEAELAPMVERFVAGGRNYRSLVKEIVTHDAYKTVQP
jgi:hypothetical protein